MKEEKSREKKIKRERKKINRNFLFERNIKINKVLLIDQSLDFFS